MLQFKIQNFEKQTKQLGDMVDSYLFTRCDSNLLGGF